MSIDVREDKMQHAELFEKPVLYARERFAKDTVPKGWYCYEIRGTHREPFKKAVLEDYVSMHYVGSVLSPVPLKKVEAQTRQIRDRFILHGEELDLKAFCKEHDFECPADPRKYILRPASPEEAGLFYSMAPEKDAELGCIGHVRIDFGRGGGRFYSTWHPRGPEELNTPEFKAEIDEVVNELRQGVLRNLNAMTDYCGKHGGKIDGGWQQNYGYIVETERYRYCLRCNPIPGDYQAYLTAFDLKVQEMNLASRESQIQRPEALRITDLFSGEPVTLRPRLELYSVKGLMGRDMPGLAVELDQTDSELGFPVPYATLTKCFGEFIGIKNAAYIDTNNCPFAGQLLEQGIAEPAGLYKTSGLCQYPLWIFKEEFLQAAGGENYQKYAQAYDQHMGEGSDTAEGKRIPKQEKAQEAEQPEPRRIGLTEAGLQKLQNAADPSLAHTYEWYVIENIRSGIDRTDHRLPLDEAIELYAGLDSDDKRLGVTKDGIATVDLVIRVDGREWFSEDWTKLASFAEDPVVAQAIQQMHQALDEPGQGMTMGGM